MKKWIGRVLITMAVLMLGCMPVYAQEEIKKDTAMETAQEVNLLQKAEDGAKKIETLSAGTTVITVEDSSNGWCKVSAKEKTGYVKITQLKTIGNKDELNAEFDQVNNTVQLIFDEIMTAQKEARQARIWGTIIVVLVIAIFGVGIASAVRKNKEKGEDTNETNNSDSVL